MADSRRSLGLGLALCRSIINAHGHEIVVKDNVPHGTIFEFTLSSKEVVLMPNCSVLVVEDDKSVRNLIVTTLQANDYPYTSAENGKEALSKIETERPDVLLLDLGLPDIDGIEVIKELRTWSNMPIIVISARSEDKDKIQALDMGADDYLTKPFSVDELLARLRVTQRRLTMISSNVSNSVFHNGKLTIDYSAGCAFVDEQQLHLTPIEFKLLCLLSKMLGKF